MSVLAGVMGVRGRMAATARRPGRDPFEWTSGPAKLVLALGITGDMKTTDMTTTAGGLWVEPGEPVTDEALRTGPRIGLNTAPEPWLSLPWRFWEAGNPFVSRGSGKRG